MLLLFGIFLLTLLVITAVAIVRATDLFVAVMMMGVLSLLMAANFFILDAADVALTEAAIGAGISTVLLLGALALVPNRERVQRTGRWTALAVVSLTALIIVYATLDKPRLGDPNAPVHTHVAPWYLEFTPEFIDIPNVVTAVLGAYRAYDTFGEVIVVLTAGIGVLFLLGVPEAPPRGADADARSRRRTQNLGHHLIPQVVGRLIVPFIVLFALYVQFHGEYGPGGGFQAGAIFAAAVILYALIEGEDAALQILSPTLLRGLMAGGALLYGATGVVTMLLGGNFLDYSVLGDDAVAGQQWGIIVIELGVGVCVAGVLLTIYHAFAARND
jgi:multicomponent Na+:H+ antiporter subunit B